ncbi:unnamed protein product [Oppiella nova]|uniref:Protein kinase domain-containing protein n=1 Tax=Oppiella nova TaxID=334625 RepID=A0A7R9QIQ4_9ACAR|nr:unnamed protein product [Oppiella nova]CAG2166747.1 unnamed protein product [Oppiella nova]
MDVLVWVTTSPYNHHNGSNFVLAMNGENHIYSWGDNSDGQLGRDVTLFGVYLKAERISYFDDKDVQQISCGSHHSLALTSNGQLSVIGSGGFGTVFRVKHKFDGQVFAVKRIEFNDFDEKETKNVLKEVKNLKKVKSEYVVKYYGSWREPKSLYIQMEFCSHSLKNILEVRHKIFERQSGDPMNLYEDLKPDNILIAQNVRNGRFLKLCDFGLATVHDKRIHYRTTQKHTADIGDLRYQAPEIGQGKKYGHKSDIYSLTLIGGELFEVDVALIDPQR